MFLFNGKQTGISYYQLMKKVKEGEGIFYECIRPFNQSDFTLGMFNYHEVYAQPYIEIALASRFYLTLEDFERLITIPTHPYWEIKDTGKKLQNTASRTAVIIGGPTTAQLHCQDGSDLKVYTIEPYMPVPDKDEEAAPPARTTVNIQMGEERTPIDLSGGNTYDYVRQLYAQQKGVDPTTIQFIVGRPFRTEQYQQPVAADVINVVERYVDVVMGGETTRIGIADDKTYNYIRQEFASKKGVDASAITLLDPDSQQPVTDYEDVTYHTAVIQVRQAGAARRRRTYRRRKNGKKTRANKKYKQ